jgi:hypothetical protein
VTAVKQVVEVLLPDFNQRSLRIAMGLDRSDTLAVTAIVISLIAPVSTIGQILQQYLGTSDGYRGCRSSVMGLWGRSTRRAFDWGDMRFEVFFETPDIFLGHPENKIGPMKQRLVHYLTGTDESYSDSRTEKMVTGADTRTDEELVSWVTLISVIQDQERISRKWDRDFDTHVIPQRLMVYPSLESPILYPLCVQMQRRKQSWSFVPSGVVKPYAFSRMIHIIEIVAMLGMQWTAFGQSVGNLVAEGNGLVLTSALVTGLGLLISFAQTGRSRFEETRVIPSMHLPDLCFGFVANILEETPTNPRRNIRLGSRDEVAATLDYFGRDFDTIRRYEKRHTHLFSGWSNSATWCLLN